MAEADDEIDIAVVGAGMAGLYTTWRLLDAGAPPDSVRLFEADDRVGGRVFTVHPPDDPSLALDLGAHNFHAHHVKVGALVERLGLRTELYAGHTASGLLHLRGRTLSNAELARTYIRKPFAYDVSAYLQRRGPARILRKALEGMARQGGETGGRVLGGRPLADWPLDAALAQVLSGEEVRYLGDRLSYSFWHAPVHAEAALQWAAQEMFHGSQAMMELPEGMEKLPLALAAAIGTRGGRIDLKHRLAELELPDSASGATILHFELADGQRRTVRAGRVILALPRGAVERIEGFSGRPPIRTLLAAVAGQRAVTTALVYPDAWWRSIGLDAGVTTTDLPARHIRHYGAEAWRGTTAGALLSYSDGGNADFWRSLVTDAETTDWVGVDHPVTAELHRQASTIFEGRLGRTLPAPVRAITRYWQNGSSSAAFHLWNAGSDPKLAIEQALKPFPDRALHICGEAWSLRQGWIEGALDTVDAVLERNFGIASAS